MWIKRRLYIGLLGLILGTPHAVADEIGTSRVSLVVAKLGGGGTSTNTISYNPKGLVTAYDIQIEGPMSFTQNWAFSYNVNNQVEKIIVEVKAPFGMQTDESIYRYDVGTNQLRDVQVSTSNGDSVLKTFSYDEDGRVTGMTMEASGQGGSTKEVHTVIYDDAGRLKGTAFTSEGEIGNHTGGYSMVYNSDGRPSSYTFQRVLQPEVTGTFTYEPIKVITVETDSAIGTTKITATLTPGPCRIPEITDGFVIEGIFKGPPGFYADGVCQR